MNKIFRLCAVSTVVFCFSSCDWWWEDDDVDASSGTETTSTSDDTSTTTSGITEYGTYHGRTNGDRPTWYFTKDMDDYPSEFELNVPDCSTGITVTNNGTRWESGGYLAKQSDVSGRGLAVLAPSSCDSETAYIVY